jgi:hypothetical protein
MFMEEIHDDELLEVLQSIEGKSFREKQNT